MNKAVSTLNRLIKKQEEIYHKYAKNLKLTDTKFWVLYAICESEGTLIQNSFCENWCYSKQTVNTAVTSLEKEGIISLEFTEGSRKQKDIRLTPMGKEFCDKNIRPVLKAEEKSLMKLSEIERQAFLNTIEKLINCLEDELID
ncbi:MAG: MarR family transcriptional regulator [Tissierellia bacterium]|nr:MarR family transcriptional regulator [Tissierellia bacterium]